MTFSLWSHLGLNQGPPDYESGATNQLSYRTPNLQHTAEIRCKGTTKNAHTQVKREKIAKIIDFILFFTHHSSLNYTVQSLIL